MRKHSKLIGVMIAAVTAGSLACAEGDRGSYAGFGARIAEPMNVSLRNAPAARPVIVTAYKTTSEKTERYQVVDEHALVRFKLVGLPEQRPKSLYRVSWKYDQQRQGTEVQELNPADVSNVAVRYSSDDSSRRVVELKVVSADGHWAGSTFIPLFGDADGKVDAEDGNVLRIAMVEKAAR